MPLSHVFTIRFIGGLNIFLPATKKSCTFSHTVKGKPSIKDTVESLRVPHTEIDAILVDGRSVDFSYQIKGGEKIRVYPDSGKIRSAAERSEAAAKQHSEGVLDRRLSIPGSIKRLQPRFPLRPRFLADVHLGKLTRHLRLLGFDTLYRRDYTDRQIIERIKKEKRIVLTRDIGLLKNKTIKYGYFVRAVDSIQRIKEVVRRYHLFDKVKPFTLCLECNGKIYKTAKTKIMHKLPPETKKFYTKFYACRSCGKVYWKGSHHRRLTVIISHACR